MPGRLAIRDVGATLLAGMLLAGGVMVGSGSATAGPGAMPGAPAEPAQDPFYAAPEGYEEAAPGTVLRSRPVEVNGLGLPLPATSWQFLARSTGAKGQPTTVVGTLMVPDAPYPSGPRPLVSYQAAIDSLGDQCNPSYTLRSGQQVELPLMMQAMSMGWAVVTSDYEGPHNAFASGHMAGHGVLDGVRGALALPGTGLAGPGTQVGLWGYSGGGLASSWAAELAPTYAPELALVGLASGGTPADLVAAARNVEGGPASGLVMLASAGLLRDYPEMLTLLNDKGHEMLARIADMCVGEAAMAFPFRRLNEFTMSKDPLSEPVAAEVMERNHLGRAKPGAPVFLYHSVLDELIPFATALELRQDWCKQGVPVAFHADVVGEHSSLAVTGAPLAVGFLASRFAGLPAPSTCG